ncbi:bifunctional peptidase and arginyl-hydroxylase JMJD5-like [Saccostrea echinata]|uniref:bifunctional peptidase and arginyl-hydroxylase JMJD5-like n=1 Tax=Saccostrea echinata TaxID=191078 RepID=UPI002A833D05|nr:bifunctional peptidase and arginyl-hydroxylase JMJD5-like [Saccostrea echinata]XP_061166533.1 bifunctional peptidase and arginyl-hydroxylase JMJD5-like [Saccostrea echinata]
MMKSSLLAFVLLAVGLCEVKASPPGHLKPLGGHRDPIGGIPVTGKFPSPWVFHEEFVKKSQPLVMRKVLEKDNIPAYRLWTDKYLREKFGNIEVEVELGKKENRSAGMLRNVTMAKFLHVYQKEDVYQVFDLTPEMKQDFNLPLSLQCGGFQNFLQMVIMWFSSGATKSHLHNDHLDNINCLLDGKKEIILIDRKYRHIVMEKGWNSKGGFSEVDVESVDMIKFPQLQNIPYNRITINKGDCLFIPYKWLHYVDSKPGRNLAVNFWFHHLPWFNSSDPDCEGVDPYQNSSVPLATLKEADHDSEFRMLFLELFEDVMSFYKRSFSKYMQREIPSITEEDVQSLDEVFSFIDKDGNKVLSWDELFSMDIKAATEKFPKLFGKIFSNITGYLVSFEEEGDEDIEISEDEEPGFLVVEDSYSVQDEGQRSKEDQPSSVKTPDDLEKEKLIKMADDGNLFMEEEPLRSPHEEL